MAKLTVTLGRTGLTVNKNGFGALPVQRVSMEAAARLLRMAYGNGIDFYDTARAYTDSEEKLGRALSDVRGQIVLATKTAAKDAGGFWKDLHESLRLLKTDVIDIYQFHNPAFCPVPGDESGLYDAAVKAREQGKIRFIGITNHRAHVARQAADSGLYDTLQFPFSYLSGETERGLVELCRERNVGFIAMKGMSGGLIRSGRVAYAFMTQYPSVLPIWGVQRERELQEFLCCQEDPPALDEAAKAEIERDRAELCGEFCRGCGYCLPCPAGIDIPNAARMSLLLRRSPSAQYYEPGWREKMERISECVHCNHCAEHCPYGLDTPRLLRDNYEDYLAVDRAGLPV